MKSVASWLFILVTSLVLFYQCKKDSLPYGDLSPGVALTFDDASVDAWMNLLPMFQKYNAYGTFFICNACSDNQLDKSKLIRLYQAGNEIGSHSLHHYYLKEYLKTHTLSDYYQFEIIPSIQFFDSLDIPVTSFAYPYGEHTWESDNYLSKYFNKLRGICSLQPSEDGAFILHKNRIVVYGAYIDRASSNHLEEFKQAILLAREHRAVLVLVGHTPDSASEYAWTFPVPLLDSICNFIVQNKMKFYHMHDL
jgi:peptidoglycan-N-acetylglucosamine deacetylase